MTTNWTPETKIGGVALASALSTVIAAIASHKGYTISPEAAAAGVGLATTAIGYLVPNQWKRLKPVEDVDEKEVAANCNYMRAWLETIEPKTPQERRALAKALQILAIEVQEGEYELEEIS